MKLRILNYGIAAGHEQVTALSSLFSKVSFSDFDAFVFDPAKVTAELRELGSKQSDRRTTADDESGSLRSALYRHAGEIVELLWHKGGVVVCILREDAFRWHAQYMGARGVNNDEFGPYFLLEKAFSYANKKKIIDQLVHGYGEQIRLESGALPPYLRILRGSLRFHATIGVNAKDELTSIFATDSLSRPVAAEVRVGAGSVLFVPATTESDPKRVGAALAQSVRELISTDIPEAAPAWAGGITVPGASRHDAIIEELRAQQAQLAKQLSALESAKEDILRHRLLLFATGKHVLEPAVRRAFRTLGYEVSEPETYDGEWDVEMRDRNGSLLIGEVEGPEGAVDVDKFRQALDYHNDRLLVGDDNKGLLVGNAYRLTPLGERDEPFTEHAMKGAARTSMALIPTPDLFRAVCEVLANDSQELKATIQDSIAACNGVWNWPPTPAAAPGSEPAVAAAQD